MSKRGKRERSKEERLKTSESLKAHFKKNGNPRFKLVYRPVVDRYSYQRLHAWVTRQKGKVRECRDCGATHKRIEWANVDHKYSANLEDYIPLCSKCHHAFDKEHNPESLKRPTRSAESRERSRVALLAYRARLKV